MLSFANVATRAAAAAASTVVASLGSPAPSNNYSAARRSRMSPVLATPHAVVVRVILQ